MPDGNIAYLTQGIQDLKTVGLLNIFKINCTDRRFEHTHKVYNFIGIVFSRLYASAVFFIDPYNRIDTQRISIYTAQVLHQHTLSFHYAEASGRGAVAVAEYAGRVAYNCNQITLIGQGERNLVIVADRSGYGRNSRGIPHIKPVKPV